MRKASVVLAVVTILSAQALAADVSGSWTVRLVTKGGAEAPTVSLSVKQEGGRLVGSCSIPDLDDPLTISGEVKDDTITWQCSSRELTASFTGAITRTGREITGSWTTNASGAGTFTATKPR